MGEHLFCVPIIEVETNQHPKPCDIQSTNQARDAIMGTKEKKRVETNSNVATWQRVERKEAGMSKGEERILAKVGGKREYSDLNQDTEATGKRENKKKKNSGCNSKHVYNSGGCFLAPLRIMIIIS